MRHFISSAIALTLVTIPVLAQQTTSPPEQTTTDSPRRLTISVSVTEPSDLKVKEGDTIKEGDLIADRGRERRQLENQKARLSLSLQQIQSVSITPPSAPMGVPELIDLPEVNYLEEQSAVELARLAWEAKTEELELLQDIDDLDPIILEHETAQLEELEQRYFLERGRLNEARQDRAYREYEHRIAEARRIEEQNQAQLAYQRQWAEYEERLRNRDYQVAQTRLRLDEIENAIASLSVVRAPYDGTVRRVKWLGQGADGQLSAEVTVMVSGSSDGGDEGAWGMEERSIDSTLLYSPTFLTFPTSNLLVYPNLFTSSNLPCLSSSIDCLTELTEQAIAHSLEIQSIDERLVLGDDRIRHAQQRRWTNLITSDIPRLVANILGGGDMQRDRIAIAELELRQADLVRRRWEVSEAIAQDIIELVLDWERLGRRLDLLNDQLQTQRQREAVMEAAYRTGAGSTTSMLVTWQRTEDMEFRLLEWQVEQTQTRQELEWLVIGFETMNEMMSETEDSSVE